MTPERLTEIRAMTAVELWEGDIQRLAAIAELLAALDAAEKDNETLRARLAEANEDAARLTRMLQRRDDGIGIDWVDDDALMAHEARLAIPTDGTP